MIADTDRPGLARGVRMVHDPVRDQPVLLYPEGVLVLNSSAAAVLQHCDGERSVADVVGRLAEDFVGLRRSDVTTLLGDLLNRRLMVRNAWTGPPSAPPRASVARRDSGARRASVAQGLPATPRSPAPMGLLAELTYRCPLHCTYCANPVNLATYTAELTTADWFQVLDQASSLGVLQVHFSGGEPLLRRDLAELVGDASSLGMYTNLVTSGIPLPEHGLAALVDAGLDHFQLSIQDSSQAVADSIAGRPAHQLKLAIAEQVKVAGLPLTVNVVLHRSNVDNVFAIAELAARLGADRVELAHTQFYGWARRNQAVLRPTDEQVAAASVAAATARDRFGESMEFVYVAADQHGNRPKPCMNGWGSRQFVVAPNGDMLPCLAAGQLPGTTPSVRSAGLSEIWYDSDLFNRFRGTEWMPEPCQSCPLKTVDFGGCRCQAYQLTGDPAATDPVCDLSPDHQRVTAPLTAEPAQPRWLR